MDNCLLPIAWQVLCVAFGEFIHNLKPVPAFEWKCLTSLNYIFLRLPILQLPVLFFLLQPTSDQAKALVTFSLSRDFNSCSPFHLHNQPGP